jgi:ribosomal protein S13
MFHHKNHHKENNLSELCSQIICEKVGFKTNSKVHELVTELKSSVNTLHEKFQHHLYQPKDVETSGKRKLLTPDPLTVALVHSTKLNQIAFVLRDVLCVVCLN